MHKLVLFDIGHVLVELTGADLLKRFAQAELEDEHIHRTWASVPGVLRFETGACDETEFAESVVAFYRLNCSAADFVDHFRNAAERKFDGVDVFLDRLAASHALACLTNTNPLQWPTSDNMNLCSMIVAVTVLVFATPIYADDEKFGLGLYVVVNDISESRDYYRQLFESEPVVDHEDFVGFRVSGGLFSLFAEDSFEHRLTRGNSVVPYIRVNDIESEFRRVKAFTDNMIHPDVVDEGPIKLFMFLDPSGNPVEFYSLVPPQ
jgi:predicted enzyme related to lactoylglutathione lyase